MKKTWIIAKEDQGISIRDFLLKRADFSKQLYKRLKEAEGVYVNGDRKKEFWRSLQTEDKLDVVFPPEERGKSLQPEAGPLSIVYEDEDLLILDKPSGIAVIPSIDKEAPSMANRILAYYMTQGISSTIHIVTRLDRNTSGLMVVAKHAYSHRLLTKKPKQIQRKYDALVQGVMTKDSGEIDQPISRLEGSIIKRTVSEKGKPAVTSYKVMERYPAHTRVRLKLHTGRTHQIRVHMSSIGHPLVGDTLYGGEETALWEGQALHCFSLAFQHPCTGERMCFTSGTPELWDTYKGCKL